MAEAVGLAAGLVSLGIQVCAGISTYLDAIKARAEDTASVKRQVQHFELVLQNAKEALVNVNSTHGILTTVAAGCLTSCEVELKSLKDFVEELIDDGPSQPNFRDKVREQTRKLTYPLNRTRLSHLETKVSLVNGTFQAALQSLSLNVSSATSRSLVSIDTHSQAISSGLSVVRSEVASANGNLLNIQRSVDSLPAAIASRVDNISIQSHNDTQVLRGGIEKLQESFQSSSQSVLLQQAEQSRQLTDIRRLLSELGAVQVPGRPDEQSRSTEMYVHRLVAKPSGLRQLCDSVSTLPGQPGTLTGRLSTTSMSQPTVYPPTTRGIGCICRRRKRYRRQQLRLGSIEIYSETALTEEHIPGCKFSQIVPNDKRQAFGLKYTGLARVLQRAVGMSFYINTGAGGFGIGPNLSYYATVDRETAPVFMLLEALKQSAMCLRDIKPTITPTSWIEIAEKILGKVQRLFHERKASPTDVTQYNESILHVIDNTISHLNHHNTLSKAAEVFRALSSYNVPLTYEITDGRSPYISILNRFVGVDAKVFGGLIPPDYPLFNNTHTPNFSCPGSTYFMGVEWMPYYPQIAEALDCGPLTLAVIANDVAQVKHILEHHPTMIQDERNILHQTPLHVAVKTPECLQLLLQHTDDGLLNATDLEGHSPVHYAALHSRQICYARDCTKLCDCECPCAISVKLLLDADCAVESDHSPIWGSFRAMMEYAIAMKERRERLSNLAMKHLLLPDIEELKLEEGEVLDSRAADVVKRLRERAIPVPAALYPGEYTETEGRSIYHQIMDVTEANIFFGLGFSEVDTPDWFGLPPLTINAHCLDYALWLVDHGAQLFHVIEYTTRALPWMKVLGATSAHFLLSDLGQVFFLNYRANIAPENKRDDIIQFTAQIMPFDVLDKCVCKCCLGGCSPFLWMLKSMLQRSPQRLLYTQFFAWYVHHFGHQMNLKNHIDAIRWGTFEALGIQHTCCSEAHGRVPVYDTDDIREIEEEQAVLLDILEDLVEDFQDRVTRILELDDTDVIGYIKKFWTGYWGDRIEEVLSKLDGNNLSDEEKRGAEGIGVKWSAQSMSPEEDKTNIQYWLRRVEEIA